MMATVNWVNGGETKNTTVEDWTESRSYRCHVLLIKEDDAAYSGVVLNLPGAGSCGDTEIETLSNVREAVRGVIESYRAHGEPIPWKESNRRDIPAGAKQTWILVDA